MSTRNTICLVMIVKNEQDFILKALESAAPYIDCVVIVDSQSTDRTEEIAFEWSRDTGIDLSFRQYTEPFHAGNKRTWALQVANGKADYLLMLDADNTLEWPGESNDPCLSPFHDLTADCYYINKRQGAIEGPWCALYKADLDWKYTGIAHEYPELIGGPGYLQPAGPIPGVVIHEAVKEAGSGSGRERHPSYYCKLAMMMETELIDNAKNIDDNLRNRYLFYIAYGYKDAGMNDRALNYFYKRVEIGGWHEEVWYSLYMIAKIKQAQNLGIWEVSYAMMQCWNYRPARKEGAYMFAGYLHSIQLYQAAWSVISFSKDLVNTDSLFLEYEIYNIHYEELYNEIKQKVAL